MRKHLNLKRWNSFITRTGTALAVILTVLSISGCGAKTVEIDLIAYTNVTFSGDNGYGYASVDFNYGALEDLLTKTLGNDNKDTLDFLADVVIIEEAIDITLDRKTDLSNGDKIILTAAFDDTIAEKYNLDVTCGTQAFEVNGLEVVPKFEISENDIQNLISDSKVTCYLTEIPVSLEQVSNIQITNIDSNIPARTAYITYSFNIDCKIALLEVTGQANYQYENNAWNCVSHYHQMAQVKKWLLAGTYTGTEWDIAGSKVGCNARYEIVETQEGVYTANVTWSASEDSTDMTEINVTIPLVSFFDTARFVITDNSSVKDELGYAPYQYRALRFDFINGGFESSGEVSLRKIDG